MATTKVLLVSSILQTPIAIKSVRHGELNHPTHLHTVTTNQFG